MAIQTTIQTLRTVTFILQSNKRLIPDFTSWYQEWRDRLASDPLMRWMVDARNKIEKQEDLETHSYVRAEIVASYLNNGPVAEVPAKLFDSIGELFDGLPKSELGEHIRATGTLRVQRRWIENTLPKYELLDAVAIAYGRISDLVADAHRQLNIATPSASAVIGEKPPEWKDGRLSCMIGHDDARTTNISLATGDVMEMITKEVKVDRDAAEKVAARYNLQPSEVFGLTGDIERVLESLFNTVRQMTERDGGHIAVAFLFTGIRSVQMRELRPESQADKYLMMRGLATDVARHGADSVVFIGEAWRAIADPSKPFMRAAEAPDREEFLTATLVRQTGDPIQLAAKITRKDDKVILEETNTERDGVFFMFAPLFEVWGRPVPKTKPKSDS